MARIFNIYFSFEGGMYTAVVSVRSNPLVTEYTLKNFNEELMSLLPGDKILSQGPGHFVFQHASAAHSAVLMEAIIQAVSEHMQTTEA